MVNETSRVKTTKSVLFREVKDGKIEQKKTNLDFPRKTSDVVLQLLLQIKMETEIKKLLEFSVENKNYISNTFMIDSTGY